MYLQRPYPDELLGSLLFRASRQLGIPLKRLIPALSGTSNAELPMFITRHSGVARAFGMSLQDFTEQHTLLPYTTGFMSEESRALLLARLLGSGDLTRSSAACAQNAVKGHRWLRFCIHCINGDLRHYGEAYWRRSHQLPGVSMCTLHECSLYVSTVSVRASTQMVSPKQASGNRIVCKLPEAVELRIAQLSQDVLFGRIKPRDWALHYRQHAVQLNYARPNGPVISEVLSNDLLAYYGRKYLKSLDLGFEANKRNAWPALLMRRSRPAITALKYVLLSIFLESNPTPSKSPDQVLKKPKGARVDWQSFETDLIRKMGEILKQNQSTGERITVSELTLRAGGGKSLHHNRHKMPNLEIWLTNFKTSDLAERQTGKRPRIYKKLQKKIK